MVVGLLIGGALVSAVIGRVVTVASPHIEDYFKRKWKGMKGELQRLKMLLPQIQSVVDAAERGEQQISDPLREWLLQLKDALYEADDVVDELDYLQLKQQAEADAANKNVRELMSHSKSRAIKLAKRIFTPDPTLDKLRRAVKKLGEVAAGVGAFVELVSNAQWEFQRQETQTIRKRETGPLLTENKVFGREEESDELLRWLTGHEDESNTNVSLFSVIGHGGMGKTTLAQLVYKDEIVQKSFDLKIWVCVSTSFDVRGLTRSILEFATRHRPDVDGLPALQDALREKLRTSGKFLLVLDDVWNDDNSSNWDKLLAPIKCGHKGSKILMTTRMDRVADVATRAMGASGKRSLKLGGLHGEDFSSIFNYYAFAGVDYGNYPNLQRIGMQIAKRLGSSPLAAKTIGGLLNSNLDDSYWNMILHSKNISVLVQHGEENIMSILMLSYHHLPLHLRSCFAYCGMFPKGHYFIKMDLVFMWMAVGLIQHSHQSQGEMLEDIGSYYFDELLRRSLFDHDKFGYWYVMHDLLSDLAQFASHGECCSFVENDKKVEDVIPNTVRHLYIESGNLYLLPKKDNWHNLRSLVLILKDARPDDFSFLEKVLKSLRSIRMLHVGMRVLQNVTMPDVFSRLIHLRILKIGYNLHQLPTSLCKLYHIQVLEFYCEKGTIKLPESMNKLVNLRHLSASDQVAGVDKLIFLRELDFSVKKERGYKIGELRDLKWLRALTIKGLENVENQEEASTAKLSNKKYLQTLHLGWSCSSDHGMDEHELVLDRLQTHTNLKMLYIEGYRGIRYANWMGNELMNNLEHMHLSNCARLDHLPPLRRLPFLKVIELKNMPAIKKLDFQCQHLKELCIYTMEGLEELSEPGGDGGQWHPHLHTLRIGYCPKLEVLPSLSLSIRKIHLSNLGLVSLPTLWLDRNSMCSTSGPSSSSLLQVLEIKNCWKITSLGKGLLQLQHYLIALERLEICNCTELVDFPSGGLQHLRALKDLNIEKCPKLRVTPGPIMPQDENDDKFLPSSLQSLEIVGACAELVRSMPTLLKGIDSLVILHLMDCEELMSLEGLMGLQSIKVLDICNCKKLMSLEGLMGLQSIRELRIFGCSELVYAAGLDFTVAVIALFIDDPLLLASEVFLRSITSVRELTFARMDQQLESIDGESEQWILKNQTTLEKIWIYKASSLMSLPGCLKNLSSLKSLVIYGANEVLIERCKKDEGADWTTISHIPEIRITSNPF